MQAPEKLPPPHLLPLLPSSYLLDLKQSAEEDRAKSTQKAKKGAGKLFQHESNIKSSHGDVAVCFSEAV